ncbi:MAG: tetratricopeptide repeat protein [bacterium]
MRKTTVLSYAVASLFCMCLPFNPAPVCSVAPIAAADGDSATDGHVSPTLRLIDFISRRNRVTGDRMVGEGKTVQASPGYDDERFAAPRHLPSDPDMENHNDVIEEAKWLAADGMVEDALLLLNGLILDNDNFMEAYLERAKLYLNKGMYDLAEKDFREAISCRASSVEAHYNLGIAYEKWAEKIEATGDGARAHEKFREAIREYKKAVWHDHGYAPAYYGLGCVCSRLGMRDDARLYFQKSLENANRDS